MSNETQPVGADGPAPAAEAPRATTVVADLAQRRATGWRLLAELLGPPDGDLVRRLRNGSVRTDFERATQWRGDDAGRFDGDLMSLAVLARQAERRGDDAVSARLAESHAELPTVVAQAAAACAELSRTCAEESAAWAADDLDTAKELNRAGRELLAAHRTVLAEATSALAAAQAHAYGPIGRLLSTYAAVEEGRAS